MTGNASMLEIIWILTTLAGLVFSSANLAEALRDWRVVRVLHPRDTRHLLASQAVRVEAARAFQFVAFATVGILSATLPPRPTVGLIIPSMFIVLATVLAVNSLLDLRVRQQINHFLTLTQPPGQPHLKPKDSL